MEDQKNNNSRLKNIARWIAVVPAAVGGIFVGWVLANLLLLWWVGGNVFTENPSTPLQVFSFIISHIFSGVLAVYWGTRVAPKARNIVAMIIGALLIILTTLNIATSFYYHDLDAWWVLTSGIAGIIAAGYIVYQFFTEGDDFRMF